MIRYGVIGTGMMGIEHINNLLHLDGVEVTAVADPHGPSIDAARAAVGDPSLPAFEDHVGIASSGLCDALVLVTPNFTHADILVDLLANDHHLLVEKPLATTVEDCRRVLAAAEGRDALTWMGLEYRYMPPVAALIEEVRAGTAGTLRMLHVREHRFPFLPKVDDWNRFSENTGGTLVEKACHFFDLMRGEDVDAAVVPDGQHDATREAVAEARGEDDPPLAVQRVLVLAEEHGPTSFPCVLPSIVTPRESVRSLTPEPSTSPHSKPHHPSRQRERAVK